MKTKLTIILLLFFCNLFLIQAQTVWLYTPKGKQVYAYENAEMSSTDIKAITDNYRTNYPLATVLGNASSTYNCHSYAWNMTEGGPICWLNQSPDLHWYWDDGSYEKTTEANAEKIFYYNGDHSAIKSSVSGKYDSKWGSAPLMRHDPEYGPATYNMQYRWYYRKVITPPTITGPDAVCPGTSGTFTAENFPGVVKWTCSGFDLPANGNTLTFTNSNPLNMNSTDNILSGEINNETNTSELPSNSSHIFPPIYFYPTCTIRAEIPCTTIAVEKEITTNSNCIFDFDLPATANNNVILKVTTETMVPSDVYWSFSPKAGVSLLETGNPAYFCFLQNKTYTVTATTRNACGSYSLSKNIAVSGVICLNCPLPNLNSMPDSLVNDIGTNNSNISIFSAYPNPTSTHLTIEIARKAIAETPSKQTLNDAILLKTEPTYDIRLYNIHGHLLRHATSKGGSVQFDVSHLHNGTYYLHVNDGVNDKPEIQQIVVKH